MTGNREPGPTVAVDRDHLIIVEGIHGLNPELVTDIPAGCVFRIYVSALTQLNLDRHNRVSTSDCRLIRRIVRDAATRGYNATDTLRRWPDSSDFLEANRLLSFLQWFRPARQTVVPENSILREFVGGSVLAGFHLWGTPTDPNAPKHGRQR